MPTPSEHKILPFKSPMGEVPGHAVLRYPVTDKGSLPRKVLFWAFDTAAQCGIETLVDFYDWTRYMANKWPAYGEIKAVILENDQVVHATCLTAAHYDDRAWHAAPVLMRNPYRIVTLCSRRVLLEVAGGNAWAWGKRRPEDAALLLDPWARDNAAYAARQSLNF